MITLITGAPGSGKTAALVQLLQRFALEGRAIFVDGIPELRVPHVTLDDPHAWHKDVPDGSVIVIDEVQRIWRPAPAGSTVAPGVEALETHRHRGIEFYLVTQHPNLLHSNVRRLVGRHIHLRDVGVLGRHWYEWPEATNPEQWRTAPIKQRYRLPRKSFAAYRSASLHVKPLRKIPPALVVCVVAVIAVAWLASRFYGRVSEVVEGTKGGPLASIAAPPGASALPVGIQVPPAPKNVPAAVLEAPRVVLVGCIHFGPRCECINDEGRSVEIELKTCVQSAERGGIAVPYMLQYPKESRPSGYGANSPMEARASSGAVAAVAAPVVLGAR